MFIGLSGLSLTSPHLSKSGPSWIIGDWTAGADTTMTTEGNRIRATRDGGNPRASVHVTGLTDGVTYRVQTTTFAGTGVDSVFFRVSATQNLDDADFAEEVGVGAINITFTADETGEVYIGFVVVADQVGEYGECNETIILSLE